MVARCEAPLGAYTAHYEALREQMTGAAASTASVRLRSRGVGLAVLLQDGLPAWLDAVTDLVAASSAASSVASPVSVERPIGAVIPIALDADLLPPAQQSEFTRLLAALVLSAVRSSCRIPPLSRVRDGAMP